MDAQALNGYIRAQIRKAVYPDRIELYLPFFFGSDNDAPLCLIWDREGVLTDGGRTLRELKRRLGDLSPYEKSIQNILAAFGMVSLEGGQKLVVRHFQTCVCGDKEFTDYLGGLSRLLQAIAQLSAVDTIAVDEDGTVRLC